MRSNLSPWALVAFLRARGCHILGGLKQSIQVVRDFQVGSYSYRSLIEGLYIPYRRLMEALYPLI